MSDDPEQQYIPRLDLRWLADLVNVLADHRSDVSHLLRIALDEEFDDLADALDVAKEATLRAEVIALRLAREHGVDHGIVGDVLRSKLAEVTP